MPKRGGQWFAQYFDNGDSYLARRNSPRDSLMFLDPPGFVRRIPLNPHQLIDPITAQRDLFTLAHIGIPRVDLSSWVLDICGAVDRPLQFTFDELRRFPKLAIETFHECAGFPRRPDIPTRRVANVIWSGTHLAEILSVSKVREEARYLWAYGLDQGEFEGRSEQYIKDLPLDSLTRSEWLLAYEINGEPLAAEHGFPIRLIAPGYYGTNSVKWLCRLELTNRRCPGVFTTSLYNDPSPDGSKTTIPVWEVQPECLIVSPGPGEQSRRGRLRVWGWAWGLHAIARVDVSCDGGNIWKPAQLEGRRQYAWQRFTWETTAPKPGRCTLLARATDVTGATQPERLARNAIHSVDVEIAVD
jgi:DMSO/TMAO reductase YedYZ molybdopterin-dependent catalytic subunit